jgi:predicted enzyme related to lactoylglutathione lyase
MKGKLMHIELPARDTKRARQFWTNLVGWKFQSWDGPVEYHMFEGEPGGAIYPSETEAQGPIVYFESDDIDADVDRIRELGGEAEDKQPIPGVGWFARAHDTEGNAFSLFQRDDGVPMPEGAGAAAQSA